MHDFPSLDIDPMRLADEWIGQPKLFHRYATAAADAQAKVDQLNAQAKVVAAELETSARQSPGSYGLQKATEGEIKALIPTLPAHQAVIKKLNSAKYDLALADAAVAAVEDRRRALENLVTLMKLDYFATPRERDGVGMEEESSRRYLSKRVTRPRNAEVSSDE